MSRKLPVFAGSRSVAPELSCPPDVVSRRDVLALLATMTALAALPSCRRPEQKIVPYVRRPEEIVPGNPLHFATALSLMGTAFGVIVESHEGRPTKIEGNPLHPESQGATTSFLQASILDLYDPDRSRGPRERGKPQPWTAAETMLTNLGQTLMKEGGQSLAVITDCHRSPTLMAAIGDLRQAMPKARILRHEPFNRAESQAGLKLAFGRPLEAIYQLAEAEVVLALDADLLGMGSSPIRAARDWSLRRSPESGPMSRLYVFESSLTVTGSNADHRFRCESSEIFGLLCALALELLARKAELSEVLSSALSQIGPRNRDARWAKRLAAIADDLSSRPGRSLIVPGARQPALVHALAHALNHALGNAGSTVKYVQCFDDADDRAAALKDLAQSMIAGTTKTVLILGVNPAYDAPGDVGLAAAIERTPVSIHVGTHGDETAAACSWHLKSRPSAGILGRRCERDGTASIVQPLIAPLFGGRTDTEIVK